MPVLLLLLSGGLFFASIAKAAEAPDPAASDPLAALAAAQVQELFQWLSQHAPDPSALSQDALNRAALRSLLLDSRTGAVLLPVAPEAAVTSVLPPLHARPVASAAYARAGALTPENLAALTAFLVSLPAEVSALLLDLRAPQPPGPLAGAAALASLFVPERTPLFLLSKPPAAPVMHSANQPPVWTRRVWLLVDEGTPTPAALAAHLLVRHRNALTFGAPASGPLMETIDRPFGPRHLIRLPAASVAWPDGTRLTGTPLVPEMAMPSRPDSRQALLTLTDPAALPDLIGERDRPRANEAALMAGLPPELPALTAAPPHPVRPDPVLQQALDLIETSSLLKLDAPEEIKRAQPGR